MTEQKNNWYLGETAPSFVNAEIAAHEALLKKGEDVAVLDLRGVSDVTDFFVLATAGSDAQVRAISDAVGEKLRETGAEMLHSEGGGSMQWVLLDFVDVVVHVLQPRAREYYRLENLWSDAARVRIDLDYFRREEIRARHPDLMLCRAEEAAENPSEPDPK